MRKILFFVSICIIFVVVALSTNAAGVYQLNTGDNWIEAEYYTNGSTGNWEEQIDSTASNGTYMYLNCNSENRGNANDVMEYRFYLNYSGPIYIWYRGIKSPSSSDGIYIQLDNGPKTLGKLDSSSWAWKLDNDAVYTVSPGEHVFRIYNRYEKGKVDKILITTNPSTVPSGIGGSALPAPGSSNPTPTPTTSITPTPSATPSSIPSPSASTPSGNLALNKTVTYSSQQTGNEAYKAVDGNASTRWSASPYPQWLQVDLGAVYVINRTEILPYSNRAYQYKIEVSQDGSSFTTVADKTGNTTGGSLLADTFADTNARYVRLTVTNCYNYTGGWASITEFRVSGGVVTTPTSTPTPTPSLTPTPTYLPSPTPTATPAPGAVPLWPLINPSFELSTSTGGWQEDDPSGVVSMTSTSNPQPRDGGRLLRISGNGGQIKQAIYQPLAGHRYKIKAWVYNHGTIGVTDLGSDIIYESSTNHGSTWMQISVEYISTGSPALIYAKYGPGSGNACFDLFEADDVSTDYDLSLTPPAKIMRYPSQVIDLSRWKITLPINNAMEIYTPTLYTYSIDPWFKLVQDQDGWAVQFRANHGGATTSGSSNPRSELREMQQNYHYQNSNSAAEWSTNQGTHIMWIKQKVTHLTYVKPHVVVGQIHGSGDDITVFRIEGLLGEGGEWDNQGTVGIMDTHAKLWITDGDNRHGYLVDPYYELGKVFEVKFIVHDGIIEYEYNGQRLPYQKRVNASGCYFKLGNYTQSHQGTAPGEVDTAYAETYVYDYYINHLP